MAEGLIVGIPAGPVSCSAMGRDAALEFGPTMAWTPSSSSRRRADASATSRSRGASAATLSTGRPSTPPLSLTWAMASSNPRCLSAEACGDPEKSSSRPIFRGTSPCGASSPAHPATATSAAASAARIPNLTASPFQAHTRPSNRRRRPHSPPPLLLLLSRPRGRIGERGLRVALAVDAPGVALEDGAPVFVRQELDAVDEGLGVVVPLAGAGVVG